MSKSLFSWAPIWYYFEPEEERNSTSRAGSPTAPGSAWKALAPGGRLIIHDFMLHEDREGPLSAALFFLSYLALRTDPISFTAGELTPLLSARGFTHISSGEMIPEITGFILAQKG